MQICEENFLNLKTQVSWDMKVRLKKKLKKYYMLIG